MVTPAVHWAVLIETESNWCKLITEFNGLAARQLSQTSAGEQLFAVLFSRLWFLFTAEMFILSFTILGEGLVGIFEAGHEWLYHLYPYL